MKRFCSCFIVVLICLNMIGCSVSSGSDKKQSKKNNKEESLKIVYLKDENDNKRIDYIREANMIIYDYFTERTGIDVEIEVLKYSDEKDLMYQVSTKGKTGELGDLIFYTTETYDEELDLNSPIQLMIKSGAIEDVRNKLNKIENTRNFLNRTEFITTCFYPHLTILHKDVIEEFDLSKEKALTELEELDMINKMVENKKCHISYEILRRELSYEQQDYYKIESNKVSFDKVKFKDYVKRVENKIKTKYISEELFKKEYERFLAEWKRYFKSHNIMRFETDIETMRDYQVNKKVTIPFNRYHLYKENQINYRLKHYLKESDFYEYDPYLYLLEDFDIKIISDGDFTQEGYLLLKSSKKKEKALKFLNYIRSKETQINMISKKRKYPIIDLEEEDLDTVLSEMTNIAGGAFYTDYHKSLIKSVNKEIDKVYIKEELTDEKLREVTIEKMLDKELNKMKLRMIFDDSYTENDIDDDLEKVVNEVNLAVEEIL